MMAQEIVTAVSEGIKLILVLVQNHGFASIGALSESLGSQRFGTSYRYRAASPAGSTATCCPSTSPPTPRAWAPRCIRVRTIEEFRDAIKHGRAATRTTAIHIETDPLAPVPAPQSWWDVPVSGVSHAAEHATGPHDLRGAQGRRSAP